MSIKVEQFKAPQGTKIYLVDPASLRLKLNQQNLLLNGKTQQITNSITNGSAGSSSNDTISGESTTNQKKVSKGVHERKHRKRKATSEEIGIDDEDDVTNKNGTKETTTRTGRISKISKCFDPKGTSISSNTSEMTTVKVKKREPASVFRCPVCQKVYIGYVKLKLHFRKFPDHYNYGNATTTTTTLTKTTTTTPAAANNSIIISNFSNQNIPSVFQQLKKCNPVSSSASSLSSTANNSSKVEVSHIETQTENIFESIDREKIKIQVSQDSQSQNVLVTQQSQSTNGLNIIERLNSINPPAYTFTTSTNTSTSSPINGFCVNSNNNNNNNNSSSSNDFNHYRGNHNNNNNNGNIRNHNNNINSNNNNNNTLLVNHSNQELDGHIFDDTLRLLLHSPPLHLISSNNISSNNNNNNSCMASAMIYQNNSNNNNHLHGATTITNRQSNILSALSPSNVIRHNNNNHNSNNSLLQNEVHHHHHQNNNSSSQKRVWDVLEEKLIHQGINEILLELTDVAEKLAKIARDKIIPIREEEEEQLRISASVPIVQVDSPFLSHLLDLPLGTYYYKEDAGRRPLLPPPISAELSLTGETELISKFLTPDIDLINLPHLTNIDVFLQ